MPCVPYQLQKWHGICRVWSMGTGATDTTLWNMNVRKLGQFEICIVISDKSQGSTAKHLSCDGLLITNLSFSLPVKEFLKSVNIRHSYRQNGLMVSYAPFASDFCPQRCRIRQISEITSVWRTETVNNCSCVNEQINVSLLSTNIKDTFWLADWQT